MLRLFNNFFLDTLTKIIKFYSFNLMYSNINLFQFLAIKIRNKVNKTI